MGDFENNNIQFDTPTGQLISRCLQSCRYREDLIVTGFPLASDRHIPVVTFAHHPRDARSSCIAFLPETHTPNADLGTLRELGIPLAFLVGAKTWEMWSLRCDGARREKRLDVDKVERFFEDHKADFAPGAVFRAKTWARAGGARQLDFVDAGLLPMVEKEAGSRLRQLFEEMLGHSLDALGSKASSMTESESHWLVRANFWLLAGKLMHDKSVPKFTRLDLNDVQNVFDRVADHYDASRIRANGKLRALRGAADLASKFASFRCISTETLGALYEEALLSPRTRKLLSVHRTPTYLVDYMLARMSHWIEDDLGVENCRVWEPSCGHAPFLVGAVRLLSDLLPEHIASDQVKRRKFLRSHIGGCDRDAFALEIARLSLTLADIPNPNGWKLDPVKDMFDGDYLARNIATNSVVCVNPPFESADVSARDRANGDLRFHRNGQAAELLRRVIQSAEPRTVFGVVVPQTILESVWFKSLRRDLMEQCEIQEITVFPDKVFQFADVETGIIIARKRAVATMASPRFLFRRVFEKGIDGFIKDYHADQNCNPLTQEQLQTDSLSLLIPRLAELWTVNPNPTRFGEIATITHGLFFLPEAHSDFPKGEITTSDETIPGLVRGFATSRGKWETHLAPATTGFNLNPKVIEWAMAGTSVGCPQVLLNHGRASRTAWRLKAFIDFDGKPFTHRFIVLRPMGPMSVEVVWALANSPYANAYSFTDSAKRDISATFLREMPVPTLADCDTKPLDNAVRAYLVAARAFSASQHGKLLPPKRQAKKALVEPAIRNEQLALDGLAVSEPEIMATDQENLRALHWRVDAEVLKLYALPAGLERELLDFFDDVPRVGVPFKQRGYIPLDFRETQRLDEFLLITDEWELTDDRRSQLVDKEYRGGGRTAGENAEFVELQRLYDLRRCYCRWQRTGDAHSPLIDEEKLKRLISEDSISRRA